MSIFDEIKLKRLESIKIVVEGAKCGTSKKELIKAVGSSSKTIERYVEEIRDFGINIISNGRPVKYTIDFDASSGLEMFEYILDNQILSAKLLKTFVASKKKHSILEYIDFEHHNEFKGLEHFDKIYSAINNKNYIQFKYKSYYTNIEKEVVIKPILLKEYNYRWYVAGYKADGNHKGEFRTYGLDRILSDIEFNGDSFKLPKGFDRKANYTHTIGVTVTKAKEVIEPVEIIFEIDKSIAKHAESLKIHKSQSIISENNDITQFSIFARPNFELWHTFLQYIPHIRIVSPPEIREHFIELMKKTIEKNL